MKIAFYLNVISPHQLPLAKEVARLVGDANFKYVYLHDLQLGRKTLGWNDENLPEWCIRGGEDTKELLDADLVYTGIRCHSLIAKRITQGKKTAYYSERWFKPIPCGKLLLPGMLRLLSPHYHEMARKVVNLLNNSNVKYLSCGPWAANDLIKLGLKKSQVVSWGYFVSPGMFPKGRTMTGTPLRVLWVGRLSYLKRVDTILKSIAVQHGEVEATIVGDGPAKNELMRKAEGKPVHFLPNQPIERIREIMRCHDVYVFSSNGLDGWGAVVNEALEEGMYVIGTRETGASAAMLPKEALFSSGDFKALAHLLAECVAAKRAGGLVGQGIGTWTAAEAAKRLALIA